MTQIIGETRAYKPREAAELMNFHVNTVYRMIADGRLRSIRKGRNYRIPASELEPYLKKGRRSEYVHAEYIRCLVDTAPPLNAGQRALIATILRTAAKPPTTSEVVSEAA